MEYPKIYPKYDFSEIANSEFDYKITKIICRVNFDIFQDHRETYRLSLIIISESFPPEMARLKNVK